MAALVASMAVDRQKLAEELYRKALHHAPGDAQLVCDVSTQR